MLKAEKLAIIGMKYLV